MDKKTHNRAPCSGHRIGRWVWFVFFYFQSFWAICHDPDQMRFQRITLREGLSQSSVSCMLQGKDGFLWLGTEAGLNRYDGYRFVTYSHNPDDPGSLSHNKVEVIYEDSAGALWVGTRHGLNRMNRDTGRFVHYRKAPAPDGLAGHSINALYEDGAGMLWVGSTGGLSVLDKDRRCRRHFLHHSTDPASLGHNYVSSICEDRSGNLWIGTFGGLNRYDRDKERFIHFTHSPGNPSHLSHNKVTATFVDSRGVLWVGTGNGLNRMEHQDGVFTVFRHRANTPFSISGNHISSIYEDSSGELWFGTYGKGLNHFSPIGKRFRGCRNNPQDPASLTGNFVRAIYEDRGKVLWVGTESGLNKLDRKEPKFGTLHLEQTLNPGQGQVRTASPGTAGNHVWAIYKDAGEEVIWFGTDGGLFRWNRSSDAMDNWSHKPGSRRGPSQNRVLAIHKGSKGYLWLGTYGGGLDRFDPETGQFKHYYPGPGDPRALSSGQVFVIREDKTGALWIGTRGGLNRLARPDSPNPEFTRWTHSPDDPRGLTHNTIKSMCLDRDGLLWIGTPDGLNRFNWHRGEFKNWRVEPGETGGLSGADISCIYQDGTGRTWIGTGSGLNRFHKKKETFSHYTTRDGLPSNKIYGILEDAGGHLWLSTNGGISRFDPMTRRFRNYDAFDGLQSNEFNGNSCFRGPDGEMFFGGLKGFNYFFPGRVKDNSMLPVVRVTEFLLFNRPVAIGADGDGILERTVSRTPEITLSYLDYFFAFEFAALDFTVPGKNRYAYKMEGFDQEWIRTGASMRFAPYSNLQPGTYTFRVKGTNHDGLWNHEGPSIRIVITPPFWRTWWFRCILALVIAVILLGMHLYRTRRLRENLAEEKRVQEILRQSRDLAEFRHAEVEKLITAISSLLVAVDAGGHIFRWNQRAERFFNIDALQCKERPFLDILQPYIAADILARIMEQGLAHDPDPASIPFEVPVDLGENCPRLLLVVINPIKDRTGKPLGFLLLAEDITHRKEEERQRLISHKLESLGQMAANIAHEIKTPLQYIGHNSTFVSDSVGEFKGLFDAVQETLADLEECGKQELGEKIRKVIREKDIEYILDEVPRASEQIVGGVEKMASIIRSMRELSHPGTGFREDADINKLLESILVILEGKKSHDVHFQLHLGANLPAVSCYPGELSQVFTNILVNALDAVQESEGPGEISVTTEWLDNEIRITIADNGCGIPDTIKDNVYNPFFTTKKVGQGTGQGLSLAHHIIKEKHKGNIRFSSKAGEGTVFYIHLPLGGKSKDETNPIC